MDVSDGEQQQEEAPGSAAAAPAADPGTAPEEVSAKEPEKGEEDDAVRTKIADWG